jgi:hypothetical protein
MLVSQMIELHETCFVENQDLIENGGILRENFYDILLLILKHTLKLFQSIIVISKNDLFKRTVSCKSILG